MSGAVELFALEALEVHRQCDLCGIPREWHGEKLSLSQRVAFMAETFRSMKEQLGSR